MWESRACTITIQLPHDIADQAEEVQKSDPEFLSRVVLYGLTRRSIYHQLRDRSAAVDIPAEVAREVLSRIQPISSVEGRAIQAENRHHDGGAWAEKDRPVR